MGSYSKRDSESTPDSGLISAFLDQELDAVWSEKVRRRVKDHPSWAAELDRQQTLRDILNRDTTPSPQGAPLRVWARLDASVRMGDGAISFWRRRLSIPIPVMAATACLIVALGLLLAYQTARSPVGRLQITTAPSGIKQVQVEAPIQELEALLRSLEVGPSAREVVVQLPQGPEFFIVGKPVLIRETDISRRSLNR